MLDAGRVSRIRIGTRGSPLALSQAKWTGERLARAWPGIEVELVTIKTSGDKILDVPLAQIGGKGLFVKEIEEALRDGEIDVAVHSMKDLPAHLPAGLILAAITEREDPRDVLVTREGGKIADLASKARVGTSSLRRRAQLSALRPDLEIVNIRGNVDTRLRKLRDREVDALLLALAGLRRMGISSPGMRILDEEEFLPAIGQGALGIEGREGDGVNDLLRPLHHVETASAVRAERAFLRRLGGSCQVPIAAKGTVINRTLRLVGLIAALDGSRLVKGESRGEAEGAEEVGYTLAARLLAQGGRQILQEIGLGEEP